jgi:hypothetical protein
MRHQPTARRVSGGLCLIQVRSPNPLPTTSPRGGGLDNYSTLTMHNTIIANSTGGGDCVSVGTIRADLRCDVGAFELQYADSDTVIKTFSDTTMHSFGPTWVSVTLSMTDTGALTFTKRLACPGGTCDGGELPATWHITSTLSAGLPLTVGFCCTQELAAVTDEASVRAFRWNSDAMPWTLPISTGLTVDDFNHCVTLTGIEGFSAWTLKATSVGATMPTVARVVRLAAHGIVPLLAGLLTLGGVVVFRRKRR